MPICKQRQWLQLPANVSGGVADAEFCELAIKRRAANSETPGNFGHATAVMTDCEPDNIGLDRFERAQVAVGIIERYACFACRRRDKQ